MTKKDYASAATQAKTAAKEYDDTSFGKQLDFLRFKADGLDAMSRRTYRAAIEAFQKALAEKDEPETRELLKQANELARGGGRPEASPKK